jgi:hypothetical protein
MSSTPSRRTDPFGFGTRPTSAEPMSWHDSSWDLRQGLEVAELTHWPHDLMPAANAASSALPSGGAAVRALRPAWDRTPADQIRR